MKRSLLTILGLLVMSALLLTACGGGGAAENDNTSDVEVPAPYGGMTNPFEGDDTAVAAGQETYNAQCASCHGPNGEGDGPAAASLDPAPANLAEAAAAESPDFLHWVIAEGGAAAGLSASMPAFKGTLSEDQIWQVVSYIESLP